MTLDSFWKWRWVWAVFVIGICVFLYGWTNHHLVEAHRVSLTDLDEKIPFLPWSSWIYWSGAFFVIVVFGMHSNSESALKQLLSSLFLVAISSCLFLLYPTFFPRNLYPIPDSDWTGSMLLTFLRDVDTPFCSTPSLHVSLTWLTLRGGTRLHPFLYLWGMAIILSTLTLKQHALIDLISGIAVAQLGKILFYRSKETVSGIAFSLNEKKGSTLRFEGKSKEESLRSRVG